MSWFSKNNDSKEVGWIELDSIEKFNEAIDSSRDKPVVFFKHSTRCSISSMAMSRLEREWDLDDQVDLYYLDLLRYREISNEIADRLTIEHQSPQLIMVKDGRVVYHASHNIIQVEKVKENC